MSEEQFPLPENSSQPAAQPTNPFGQAMNSGQQSPFPFQVQLPNATAVLILGIVSIVTCCCYGITGLIFGVVALILAGKDRKLYMANPSAYTLSSFKNLNAGRVCAFVGLILSAIIILANIAVIMIFGMSALSDTQSLREALEGLR